MKRFFILCLIFSIFAGPVSALNFGMYKPEEDYGLIDGFKINFSKEKRQERHKLFELTDDIPEERARIKREKEYYEKHKDQKSDDEYQMFKFMLDDTIAF